MERQSDSIETCTSAELVYVWGCGYSRWFEQLLAELGFELWIGDPAEVKTKRVKKQKTDRNDAPLLLRLMLST